MKKRYIFFIQTALLCLIFITDSFSAVGAGFHWGFDFTLKMKDMEKDQLSFDSFSSENTINLLGSDDLNIDQYLPEGMKFQELKDSINEHKEAFKKSAPFYFSRNGWTRTKIDFGGKIYIDNIPVFDVLELSFNLGAWEYEAVLHYPTGEIQDNITLEDIQEFTQNADYEKIFKMEEFPITLEHLGMEYLNILGFTKTPYFKFHFDLTLRKYLFQVPSNFQTFRMYLGVGPSLHIATPVLTSSIVEEQIMKYINDPNTLSNLGNAISPQNMKQVLEEFLNNQKRNLTAGMNIASGFMLKFPVIPFGLYFDAKFMIPFGDIDKNVDLNGFGFLLNGGIFLEI